MARGLYGHSGCPGVAGDEKGVIEIVQRERMEKCSWVFVGEFEAFIYYTMDSFQIKNNNKMKHAISRKIKYIFTN